MLRLNHVQYKTWAEIRDFLITKKKDRKFQSDDYLFSHSHIRRPLADSNSVEQYEHLCASLFCTSTCNWNTQDLCWPYQTSRKRTTKLETGNGYVECKLKLREIVKSVDVFSVFLWHHFSSKDMRQIVALNLIPKFYLKSEVIQGDKKPSFRKGHDPKRLGRWRHENKWGTHLTICIE